MHFIEQGKESHMEYFDIVDEQGNPTGQTVERKQAHRNNILHRTAHVWIVRRRGNSIHRQGVLLLLKVHSYHS